MVDLNQLIDALESIRKERKTAKVFFYFVNRDDGRMQSGFFSIGEGKSCSINYLAKPNDMALTEIPYLNLTKVMSLPATLLDLSNQKLPACDLGKVLDQLRSARLPIASPQSESAFNGIDVEIPASGGSLEPATHIAMQRDVMNLLESLYGTGAHQRVQEIAQSLPPQNYPIEFLNKCKLHASLMLGPKKADEIFRTIYERYARQQPLRYRYEINDNNPIG